MKRDFNLFSKFPEFVVLKESLLSSRAKVDLKDRLPLELLNKAHRDTLRVPELWRDIELGDMILALDCSLHVNLLVTGVHPWRPECLSRFNSYAQGQDAAPEYEAIESKLERVAASTAPEFEGSKAAYQMFVDKIFSLVELREKVEAISGRSASGMRGATAKVVSETVVFELLEEAKPPLLEELRQYLQESPDKLRLVFRNCLLKGDRFRFLCGLIGDCGIGCVVFEQHFPFEKPDMARAILGCAELQRSTGLHTLELDFPLSVTDLESVALFLDRNEHVSEVAIHLRPAFYSKSAGGFQQVLSKLKELCASERGARVRLVRMRYRGGAPLQTEGAEGGTERDEAFDDAFLALVEEEVQSAYRFQRALQELDRAVAFFQLADLILCLAVLLDYLFVWGVFAFMSTDAKWMTIQLFWAGIFVWPPLEATLQGRPDPMGIFAGLFVCGFVKTWAVLALGAFFAYLGACLVWTVVRQVGKAAAAGCRLVAARLRGPRDEPLLA
ncbi:hypothetical protein KFL_003090090 [Klebsormidium nitens]|uniref:Uncharacterized protein n=1 Tax=Klebsormidium nitens TaxID=105231 RepID=A0A1Y1I9W8_KLENI|nr:hypothetical protein KFL_003090090 [Klebsormidium nitens]|eukprot:GAQ86752.1 hypothetical protein KFL_003090090 [Klebsormidium nitens]